MVVYASKMVQKSLNIYLFYKWYQTKPHPQTRKSMKTKQVEKPNRKMWGVVSANQKLKFFIMRSQTNEWGRWRDGEEIKGNTCERIKNSRVSKVLRMTYQLNLDLASILI